MADIICEEGRTPYQIFDGIHFRIDKRCGYFWSTKKYLKKSMHKYVWEYYNGELQDGWEVHHKDFDKSNNSIENLIALPRADHRRLHQMKKLGIEGVFDGKCIVCGKTIPPTTGHVICSAACKQKFARQSGRYLIEKTCIVCGKPFKTNKHRQGDTCSKYCAGLVSWQTKLANGSRIN